MHGIYLENVTQWKYLGVILHRKLSWKPHISNVVAKANSTRYFLQRNLSTCSRDVILQCKVESVPRKAVRLITNDWRSSTSPIKMLEEQGLKY